MMDERVNPLREGRLWVLFDGSRGSQAALLQAAPIAQVSGRELRALYVEDQSLINCSGLSVVSEVGAVSGQVRPVSLASHRASQRVRRQRAQACIDHLLGPIGLSLRLETDRGEPIDVLRARVAVEDWVVVGRGGYASWQAGRLGSLTRCLIEQLHTTLLISSPSAVQMPGAWLLLLDSDQDLQGRCEVAASLAASMGVGLQVVLDPALQTDEAFSFDALRTRVAGPLTLQKLIQDHQAAGLMATADSLLVRQGLTAGWLSEVDRPLLVLRD